MEKGWQIKKALGTRKEQTISTNYLIERAECALKNSIFLHCNSISKQLRGIPIWTKMVKPYIIIFLDSLEEEQSRF